MLKYFFQKSIDVYAFINFMTDGNKIRKKHNENAGCELGVT